MNFSNKLMRKIMNKEVTEGLAELIDARLHPSLVFYRPFSNLLPMDIRKVFKQTEEDDQILIDYYKRYVLKDDDWDNIAINIAKAVNQRLVYKPDEDNWGQSEYWASPINVHLQGIDDCDGYAVLTVYLWGLFGIPAYRRFVRAGGVEGGGHATALYLSLKTNEIYPLEGSYYAKESWNNFNKKPLYSNSRYLDTWWITNEEKSYSGNYLFKFINGMR